MTKKEMNKDTKQTAYHAAISSPAPHLRRPGPQLWASLGSQGAGADQDALAEHLADQGHLP